MQSDVKKAVDAKAYPRVSADIRHQLGTLRCCNSSLIHAISSNNAEVHTKAMHVHACLSNPVGILATLLTDIVQLSKHSHSASAEQSKNLLVTLSP